MVRCRQARWGPPPPASPDLPSRKDCPLFRSLRFWAGVAVSAVFIALFLRATHPREIADALEAANYWYLLPAGVVLFIAICARCVRWSVLMRPVKPMSPVQLFPYAIIG